MHFISSSETYAHHEEYIYIYSNLVVDFSSSNYASMSSEAAYSDRQLTTNFELWHEFFFFLCVCQHVSMWGFQNRFCLSVPFVCPYPEKRNHPSFINISPTLVIDTSMETSSRVLHHGNPKNQKNSISKKFEIEFWLLFWIVLKCWNHPSFVDISPTFVNDTSMEKFSQFLYHEKSKIWFY